MPDKFEQELEAFRKKYEEGIIDQNIKRFEKELSEVEEDLPDWAVGFGRLQPAKDQIRNDEGVVNWLTDFYEWLNTDVDSPTLSHWLWRTLPKSAIGDAANLGVATFDLAQSFIEPQEQFLEDVFVRGVDPFKSAKARGIDLGRGAVNALFGMGDWLGGVTGLKGGKEFKHQWKEHPIGSLFGIEMLGRGVQVAGKKIIRRGNVIGEDKLIQTELNKKPNIFRRAYEAVDIRAPFERVGATRVGISIQAIPSIIISETKRFMDYSKAIRKYKLNAEEGFLATLKAANPKLKVPDKVAKAAAALNQYYKDAFVRLKASGILQHPWPESMRLRNSKRISELRAELNKEWIGLQELLRERAKPTTHKVISEKRTERIVSGKEQAVPPTLENLTKMQESWIARIKEALGNRGFSEGETNIAISHLRGEAAATNIPIERIIEIERVVESAFEGMAKLGRGIKQSEAKIGKLSMDIADLQTINKTLAKLAPEYTHIPLKYWYDKIESALGPEIAQQTINGYARKYYKGRFFQQRKTIDISGLIDELKQMKDPKGKPIFADIDFDARVIASHYSHQVGVMRGLAGVFNQAKKAGLLKRKPSPNATPPIGFSSWNPELQLRFPELKEYWGHTSFANYMEKRYAKLIGHQRLRAFFGVTKMLAFYNPLFLPGYDLYQAAWVGSVSPLRPLQSAKYLYKGVRDVTSRSPRYYEALENVTFSTPYAPRFTEVVEQLRNDMPRSLRRSLKKAQKLSVKVPILTDFYRHTWNCAWFMDNCIRMASYNYLRDIKGLSPKEAGAMTAWAHADYSRLDPKARRFLNYFLFTPTFKYVMTQAQMQMVRGSVGIMKSALKLKAPKARDVMFAKGFASLTGSLMAQELIMKRLGFKTDEWGVRYYKPVITESGEKKEFVLYVPNPNNVLLRMVHKFTKWGPDENKAQELLNKAHWYFHPLHATFTEAFILNKQPDGTPVYDPNDNWDAVAKDIAKFSTMRIVAALKWAEQIASDNTKTKKVNDMLQDDIGKIWEYILRPVTYRYLREPKEKRIKWLMQKTVETFRKRRMREKWYKRDVDPKRIQERLKNFREEMEKIQKEWEKSGD